MKEYIINVEGVNFKVKAVELKHAIVKAVTSYMMKYPDRKHLVVEDVSDWDI